MTITIPATTTYTGTSIYLLAAAPGTWASPNVGSVTLSHAAKATVDAKRRANCRTDYVKELERFLKKFSKGRESMLISKVTLEDVESFLDHLGGVSSTRVGNGGKLSAMFQVALRRGWVERNVCRRLEPIRIERKPPFILSPELAEDILTFVRLKKSRWLAYVVLALFAGVRPAELLRIDWDCVSLSNWTVRIDAAVSKIHRRRIVHLFPNAKAWIKLAKEHYTSELGTLSYMGLRRLHKRICKHVGWKKFPQDVFRHTAASYMVGELKDPGRVANELGNSPRILLQHYRELVSDEDTRKFWAILPPKELIS